MVVDILLASYNGEAFLREQLESLVRQTMTDWKLYIRDDGSTDDTLAIIRQYCKKYPEKITVLEDAEHLGAQGNFSRLIQHSTAPYVMLCDQDDIWKNDKIEHSLQAMRELEERHGAAVPLLVHSDMEVVDPRGTLLSASFAKRRGIKGAESRLHYALLTNNVTGCTICMNRALVNKLQVIPVQARMHDMWIGLVAILEGVISFLDVPLVEYRLHGRNVIGAPGAGIMARIPSICRWRSQVREMLSANIAQAKALDTVYEGKMSAEDAAILADFTALEKAGWLKKRHLIWKRRFFRHTIKDTLALLLFC